MRPINYGTRIIFSDNEGIILGDGKKILLDYDDNIIMNDLSDPNKPFAIMNASGEWYPAQSNIKDVLQFSDFIEKDRIFVTNEVWSRLTSDDKIWLHDKYGDSLFVFRDDVKYGDNDELETFIDDKYGDD